ncbi:flagellar basal body P-ring formation chaperone FlgA [Halioxenophilus sp. WMMB6]|uniref:flagellar basal body P-ring formation chaperone FlgA n=1 Tax=Halioxenophilus sp. WMMB6 TaxID=3073815 RepID=UPI00295F12B9|nr:flagellar basal body P-ring formation chaperone FlgA [Halioxenophilus sp. WMMB6]
MAKIPLGAKDLFRWTLLAGLAMCHPLVLAEPATDATAELQSMQKLADQVTFTLEEHYTSVARFDEVRVQTNLPDSRLQLPACDGQLRIDAPDNYRGGRVTTQVHCDGNLSHWSLYFISEVKLLAQVVVARAPLRKGELIAEADLELALKDVSLLGQGYITDSGDVAGQELRRGINTGDELRAQWLIAPKAVKRGDRVTIIASSKQVAVEATGTALADGRIGEQIRVRNDRSERVVRATVSKAGVVNIPL